MHNLQQKNLPLQHLLNLKALVAELKTGHLHSKSAVRAQGAFPPFFSHRRRRKGWFDKSLPSSHLIPFFPGTLLSNLKSPEMKMGKRRRVCGESRSHGFESQFCYLGPSSGCQYLVSPSPNRKADNNCFVPVSL